MPIIPFEKYENRNRANQKYSLLLEKSKNYVNSSKTINIILLENMWVNPIPSRIEQIIEKIQKIESGSIIIYTYGISINEIIPISNYESKNDIIEYLQLIIPEIVSCQWRDLEIEQVIKTIEKYDRFDSFTEKKIIIS
jgi:hypothetical protein